METGVCGTFGNAVPGRECARLPKPAKAEDGVLGEPERKGLTLDYTPECTFAGRGARGCTLVRLQRRQGLA